MGVGRQEYGQLETSSHQGILIEVSIASTKPRTTIASARMRSLGRAIPVELDFVQGRRTVGEVFK